MEVIYPVSEKRAIHPIAIFKEGFGLWAKNSLGLAGIFLTLHMPVMALQILFPAKEVCGLGPGLAKSSPGGKLISLFGFLVGSWAFVALAIGINKISQAKGSAKVIENIKDALRRILPYLGTVILYGLLLGIIMIVCAAGIALIPLLRKSNSAGVIYLGLAIFFTIGIAGLCAEVYYAIRLSLGGLASAIENKGPISALKRSHALIKNYVNPVAGEYGLLMLVSIAAAVLLMFYVVILTSVIKVRPIYAGVLICWYLISSCLSPLLVSILVNLYQKLKEAAD